MTHAFPIGLEQLSETLEAKTDPRRTITAKQLEAYAGVLTDIAKQSKRDGEILWGRIQATKYERKAHQWIFDRLQTTGLDDLHFDKFPSGFGDWPEYDEVKRPTMMF